MLTNQQIQQIEATVPVLKAHGVDLTTHFYRRMLSGNPELRNIFNAAHQSRGEQQRALAGAVLAFAENIRTPEKLAAAVRHIAVKHCTIGIRSEQYAIVGRHLLASIKEVLGDAATPELLDAWAAAYGMLAQILADAEQGIYDEQAKAEGGWTGWRPFTCLERREESQDAVSFTLMPADGGELPQWKPGQFVSVRVFVPSLGAMQPRQYSICEAAGNRRLRICVKRVDESKDAPAGRVSQVLHQSLKVGDMIEVSAPMGDFVLDPHGKRPAVFIAAGIGITPIAAMLEAQASENPLRETTFVYSTQNSKRFPLKADVERALAGLKNARRSLFFTQPLPEDRLGSDYDAAGRLDAQGVRNLLVDQAEYWICGPSCFIDMTASALRACGVPADRIHFEAFTTGVQTA